MSTIVRYSSGSTYTLVPNKVDIEKVQDLDGQYHIPNTSIVGMMRLGLGVQRITVSGDILDMSACLWHDVVAISFDSGTSYQTVYFAGVPYTSDCWSGIYPYALSLLASPLKERTAVRYPTTGYKWGNQSITGIGQAGNVNAFPTIHYLAPLFYAPLSNTLIDFAGQSVTFTRTASKTHKGVVYPINTPIFDSGLYLASDTAQDVATWTPPASTLRTVCMKIKSRYPSPWVIGGSGSNLLTANQSNAETNTTGMAAGSGTLTRNTTTPIAGSGDFKVVSTGGDMLLYTSTNVAVTAGRWYMLQMLAKCVGMASGRQIRLGFAWYNAGAGLISQTTGLAIACPTSATLLYMGAQAPVGAVSVQVYPIVPSSATGEIFYADSLMVEAVPINLTVWTSGTNALRINTIDNLLRFEDGSAEVALALPAAYLAGTVMDVVLLDDISHAVTMAVHPAGGSWTSATGTLAAITWPQLTLGDLEGSIANLVEYPYVLTSAEYQALAYSSLSLLFNTLYIGNRYAREVVKGSDKRLLNALGSDISALLGGTDIPIIGINLLTANQSNAETDTTGMIGTPGTFTRTAAGDFKLVANSTNDLQITTGGAPTLVTVGLWYSAQVLVNTGGMAVGRQMNIRIRWMNAASETISYTSSSAISCPSTATLLSVVGQAPALAVTATVYVVVTAAVSGEILYANKFMIEVVPTALTVPSPWVIGTSVTIAQSQGLSARWYVEVKRTDV